MITDVEGIRVGHWTHPEGITGCTVLLLPEGTSGSCEWRGGAPGSREWVVLQPENRVDRVHAIVLSGSSAFGLAVADGVMSWLEERRIGWEVGGRFDPPLRVPIVPTAILLDAGAAHPEARPTAESGRLACESATDGEFECGSVGAGTGCTCAKIYGVEQGMKSGIGTASVSRGDLVVAALVAANPVGEVLDENGGILAGSRTSDRSTVFQLTGGNTMLGVVATNGRLSKQDLFHVARAGQDGIATVVRPAHTRYDGDVVFSLGTRAVDAELDLVLALVPQVIAAAVRHGVRSAKGAAGFPGLAD